MAKLINLRNRARQLASKALKTMGKPFARCLGKTTPAVEDNANPVEPATPPASEDKQQPAQTPTFEAPAVIQCSATSATTVEPKPASPLITLLADLPGPLVPYSATPAEKTKAVALVPYSPSPVGMPGGTALVPYTPTTEGGDEELELDAGVKGEEEQEGGVLQALGWDGERFLEEWRQLRKLREDSDSDDE